MTLIHDMTRLDDDRDQAVRGIFEVRGRRSTMSNTTHHGSSAGAPEPAAPQSDSERRMRQMVADPAGYFARARQEAKSEARRYVSKRLRARTV